MSGLEDWIARQYTHSTAGLMGSIAPIRIVKSRPHFHQTITPAKGSVVASPVLAGYDPDPDYFFHWYRDAAIVIDALRLLHRDGLADAQTLFADFVAFNLSLQKLDGRTHAPLEAEPDFAKFLRRDMASAHGDAIPTETRINPDGTLDVSDWPRPQHDGTALRALTVMRWMKSAALLGPDRQAAEHLLRADLAFIRNHARQPCFDIWEEELGLHYYTLRVCAAALGAGAAWLESHDDLEAAQGCLAEEVAIKILLDGYWRSEGYIGSRPPSGGIVSSKDRDFSVILGVIHSEEEEIESGLHSVRDPRLLATLATLEVLFADAYAINGNRPPDRAPAMGRYPGDNYYSGGAYYFSTLGAAEFCYRAGQPARGDAFLETVRAFTPDTGNLSEQFDQTSGAQTSAKQLAWSHAAFLSAIAARRAGQLRA